MSLRDLSILRAVYDPAVRDTDFASFVEHESGYRVSPEPSSASAERAVIGYRSWQTDTYEHDESRDRILALEHDLLPVLADMERAGILIDRARLSTIGREIADRVRVVEESIYASVGERFNVRSTHEVQRILFERLGLKSLKKTKTGVSVDTETLTALASEYAIAGDILEHRTLEKLRGTYVDGLTKHIRPETGRIHTTYRQFGAATGRLSSENPNLQNIPSGEGYSDSIRSCFVAERGYTFIVADYSQVELRILANMSGDEVLLDTFRQGEDIHTRTARFIFGESMHITSDMRRIAKSVNFGVVYGITGYGLSRMIRSTPAEADRYIETFFATYHGVKDYYEHILARARETGYVETYFGRRRYLPTIRDANRTIRERTEREGINMPIQGTSADIVKYAMIHIHERFRAENMKSRLLLQVHDELLIESPESEALKAEAIIKDAMEHVVEWSAPLLVDIHTGTDWLTAKKG